MAAAVDTCGPYEYYGSSCESEHDNAIFRRLRTGHKNNVRQESLVLDIDQLFKEIPNMVALGRIKPSLDHNLIAIIVELKSSETKSDTSSTGTAVLYLKDIDQNLISKIDISEILQSSIYGPAQQATLCPSIIDVEWAVDTSGRTLLYLVLDDELHRPSLVVVLDIGQLKVKLFEHNTRHKGGSARIFKVFSPSRDDFKFVAREDDVAYNIDVGRSKDDKFVIISSHSKVSSEVSIIPIPAPLDGLYSFARPLTIRSRQRGLKYYVDHCGHYFYVATNKPRSHGEQETMISPVLPELGVSSDLSIIRCASSTVIEYSINNETSFRSWTSVYPPKIHDTNNEASKSSVVVNDFDIFLEKMVVYGRVDGFPSVRILDLARQLFSADMTREDIPVVDLTQQIRDVVGSKMFFIRVGMNSFDSSAALFSVSNPIMPGKLYS